MLVFLFTVQAKMNKKEMHSSWLLNNSIKSRWPSWSKAPVSGTCAKGQGFESHSCHDFFINNINYLELERAMLCCISNWQRWEL